MNTVTMKWIFMSRQRVDLCLEYNDELIHTASVINTYKSIERQRYLWVKLYGLTPKKNWKIYINIVSSMGKFDPIKLTKKQFNHQLKNENNESETIDEFL